MATDDELQTLTDLHARGLLSDDELASARSRLEAGLPADGPFAAPADETPYLTAGQATAGASGGARRAGRSRRRWFAATTFAAFVLAIVGIGVYPRTQYLAAPLLCREGSRASVRTERYYRYDGDGVVETELACVEPGEGGAVRVVHTAVVTATLAVEYTMVLWLMLVAVGALRRRRAAGPDPLAAP